MVGTGAAALLAAMGTGGWLIVGWRAVSGNRDFSSSDVREVRFRPQRVCFPWLEDAQRHFQRHLRCLRRLSEDASRVWYLGLNCTFGRTHDRSASGEKHLDRLTRHLVRSDALPDRRDILCCGYRNFRPKADYGSQKNCHERMRMIRVHSRSDLV